MASPTVAAEWKARPFYSAGRSRKHAWARFTVGAAGVVTLDTAFSDPGITLGNFSSGVAALVFPSCKKALVKAQIEPAAVANDNHIKTLSTNATAGTASLRVEDDGSAEDPSDGAVIYVEIIAEPHG